MPIASREDPFKSHSFLAEIDGIASAFFKSVSGLDAEVEVIELRSIEELVTRKLPGRVRFSNVRLERGLTTSRDLFDWWAAVLDGAVDRRGVAIMLLDDGRRPVLRWELQQAWPVKWEIAELDAAKNEVAIESLTLCHEGFRLVD